MSNLHKKLLLCLLCLIGLLSLVSCTVSNAQTANADMMAEQLIVPPIELPAVEASDKWTEVPVIWKDNSGAFGIVDTGPSIMDFGGSNLMNTYLPPERTYEPENSFEPDEEYDLVFYWSSTRSRGAWIFQIAPEGSEEWVDFPRHGEYYAGSCICEAHGQYRAIDKFCIDFESEVNGMYQIRQIIEGGVDGIEGEVVLWHLHDIPIKGVNKLLIKADVENYANWPYGRTAILLDEMEFCEYCPKAWQSRGKK